MTRIGSVAVVQHLTSMLLARSAVATQFLSSGACTAGQRVTATEAARMSTVAKATETSNAVQAMNVLGGPLQCCCKSPMTGFYRDGYCRTGGGDYGVHVVCAQVTAEFLEYTASRGNDLSTPAPQFNFPGLKPGDRWCLCASRWKEAAMAGKAPPVVLSASHVRALDYVDLELLKQHALQEEPAAE